MKRAGLWLLVLAAALGLAFWAAAAGAQSGGTAFYTGTLDVVWGNPADSAAGPPSIDFSLALADGRTIALLPGRVSAAELLALHREMVTVGGRAGVHPPATWQPDQPALAVDTVRLSGQPRAPEAAHITGNTRWVTLACKFPDRPDEPFPLSFYQEMYRNSFVGLNHYWREASYGLMNLDGSQAFGWYTLPEPYSAYVSDQYLALDKYLTDCAAAADTDVYFPDYYGINLIVANDDLEFAWGGGRTLTLDGVNRRWGVTWMTDWAMRWISEFKHEMGHSFGLFHSYSGTNQYGNYWDVMSRDEYNCDTFYDPVYSCYGQHTIGRNKEYLGWIPPERVYVAGPGSHTVTLERLALPGPSGYLLVEIPVDGSSSHYYTLEARLRVGYDNKLFADGVLIHEIGGSSRWFELVSLGGMGNRNANSSDRFIFVWQPGETFASPYGGIVVHVDAATGTGYTVTIHNGWSYRTDVLNPIHDTYVDEYAQTTSFGTSPQLLAEKWTASGMHASRMTYLRFDSEAVPVTVSDVDLRIYVIDDDGVDLPSHACHFEPWDKFSGALWTESTLTWRSRGACWHASWTDYPSSRVGDWMTHDLTFEYGGGYNSFGWDPAKPFLSFGLDGYDAAGPIRYSSKEGLHAPELVVKYLVPSDATATATPPPDTTTLSPTNDAYVSSGSPTANYGAAIELRVRHAAADLHSYLKFNLGKLPGPVGRATLGLFVTDGGADGGTLYLSSSDYLGGGNWLEEGLTWANAPPLDGPVVASLGAVTAGRWVEIDVTQAVLAAQAEGNRVSFGIANNSSDRVVFSSKEGAASPQLVIAHNVAPPPTWTPTATTSPIATPSPTATLLPPTATATPSPTPSATPPPTATATPSPTATATPSPTGQVYLPVQLVP